jgi:hypothetical protein
MYFDNYRSANIILYKSKGFMKARKLELNKATIMSIKMRRLQLFTTSQCRRIRCNPGPCNYPYILECVA